jgi:hypothetical protein
MQPKIPLTQARLKELLHYDPETGVFTRLIGCGGVRAGTVAGYVGNCGYACIKVDWIEYRAHRLAFLYITGSWPPEEVDHINGLKTDNRWMNLRPATSQENKHNNGRPQRDNKSGYLGVRWHKHAKKFQAQIKLDRRNYHLGYFDDPAEAAAAHLAAKDKMHPTHQRLRRAA